MFHDKVQVKRRRLKNNKKYNKTINENAKSNTSHSANNIKNCQFWTI